MRTLFLLLLAVVPVAFPAKKPQQPKPAAIEVLETSAIRDGDYLNVDGRLKNVGERAANRVVISIDILDSDKRAITIAKGESEPSSIEPEEEAIFHARLSSPARAVYFRLSFVEGNGRDLKSTNTGPFAIE